MHKWVVSYECELVQMFLQLGFASDVRHALSPRRMACAASFRQKQRIPVKS